MNSEDTPYTVSSSFHESRQSLLLLLGGIKKLLDGSPSVRGYEDRFEGILAELDGMESAFRKGMRQQ